MEWVEVKYNKDIEELLHSFGEFHDSCLKELYMWTESYVEDNLSMSPVPDTNVRILFQRQYRNPSAIELLFSGLTQFHIVPRQGNYESIIQDAKLLLHKGLFYWSNDNNWEPENSILSDTSWLSAKSLKWREVSSWMGKENRYGIISNIN